MQLKNWQRTKLVGLLCVFVLPVLWSYFYFYVVKPQGGNVQGVLIQPALALPEKVMNVVFSSSHPRWWLLGFAPLECQTVCEEMLWKMRQLRLAQAENQRRIERLWVVDKTPQQWLSQADVPAELVRGVNIVANSALVAFLEQKALPIGDGSIYLVDPRGFLVMRWPPGVPVERWIQDLRRILKYSRVG